MPNHASAKRRVVRNKKAEIRNKSYLSAIRTFVKKVEKAILGGNKEEAKKSFVKAESALSKGVRHGVVKKEAAARKTSRLSAKVKKMAQ